jgi:Uma2 family endonuclease
MFTEEMLALPDNGLERWLIRGRLREKPKVALALQRSRILARITELLHSWLEQHPQPRGLIQVGKLALRLHRNPDSTVWGDVAYVLGAAFTARESDKVLLFEGVPVLVVEILLPKDKVGDIHEKTDAHLEAGVLLVWLVNPRERTVRTYRPGHEPELVNFCEELSGEPHLPGFRFPVGQIFG